MTVQVEPIGDVAAAVHVIRATTPRGLWVGIFAQRAQTRPNRIGRAIGRGVRIEGVKVQVAAPDALHGARVLWSR